MRKSPFVLSAAALVALVSISSAQPYPSAGYIGVFADLAGTQCCIQTTPPAPITFYSMMILGGTTADGITGAEYRIDVPGLTGLFVTNSPNPASTVSLGNPLDDPANAGDNGGNNIAFAQCQTVSPVLLHTFSGFNSAVATADLTVKAKSVPTNPNFNCPLVTLCDDPVFTVVCLTITKEVNNGVDPIIFNAAIRAPGACPALTCTAVGVESSTWSSMKGLYR